MAEIVVLVPGRHRPPGSARKGRGRPAGKRFVRGRAAARQSFGGYRGLCPRRLPGDPRRRGEGGACGAAGPVATRVRPEHCCQRPVTCPNDRERPRRREFASRCSEWAKHWGCRSWSCSDEAAWHAEQFASATLTSYLSAVPEFAATGSKDVGQVTVGYRSFSIRSQGQQHLCRAPRRP